MATLLWSEWRNRNPKPGECWATGEKDLSKAVSYTGPPVDEDDPKHRYDAYQYLRQQQSRVCNSITRYRDDLVDANQALGGDWQVQLDAIQQALDAIRRADGGLISRLAPDLP
ncbi:MAG: hypothetical protein U9R79_05085 [Armatimonadota bacterium]|nr:hypothetical protein [Armatimonadota bacterium]